MTPSVGEAGSYSLSPNLLVEKVPDDYRMKAFIPNRIISANTVRERLVLVLRS